MRAGFVGLIWLMIPFLSSLLVNPQIMRRRWITGAEVNGEKIAGKNGQVSIKGDSQVSTLVMFNTKQIQCGRSARI